MGKMRAWFNKNKDRMAQKKINQPKWLSWLIKGLGILVVIGLMVSGFSMWQEQRTPAEEVVIRAIAETIQAPSYSYYSLSKRVTQGKEELLSEVWGEKNSESTHLRGKIHIVNSAFEIYQVNDRFYRQDVVSKDWVVVEDFGKDATVKLMQEIDPLGNFVFGGEIEAEYLGKEKIDNRSCRKYQIVAYNENIYLTSLWGEFFYTVWIDKAGYVRQAEIIASDKENNDQQLKMLVKFTVGDEIVHIEAPM